MFFVSGKFSFIDLGRGGVLPPSPPPWQRAWWSCYVLFVILFHCAVFFPLSFWTQQWGSVESRHLLALGSYIFMSNMHNWPHTSTHLISTLASLRLFAVSFCKFLPVTGSSLGSILTMLQTFVHNFAIKSHRSLRHININSPFLQLIACSVFSVEP